MNDPGAARAGACIEGGSRAGQATKPLLVVIAVVTFVVSPGATSAGADVTFTAA
jgi:hypothetical protein